MRRHLFTTTMIAFAAGACFAGWRFFMHATKGDAGAAIEENLYRFGNITTNTQRAEIRFQGEVVQSEGGVQHLIYLDGYKWLAEESAIVSDAALSDLQKAIAVLDWGLWDALWLREARPHKGRALPVPNVSIAWGGREVFARELVVADDELEAGDFIFFGSPYFDHLALGGASDVDCLSCPLFPLEQKVLREMFVRKSGKTGYALNEATMPAPGAVVDIIIRLAR